eukprot:TRINITY_DN18828_c0_g1_i1.p1 TRINITY_DN18828_c0_g1~~TRINITY_DN18828_c0_g1_i1.p1  ORF type:complete len:494 (-),score=171.44 TRINITY_DN18828_c0_g1_i1:142-1623(-)
MAPLTAAEAAAGTQTVKVEEDASKADNAGGDEGVDYGDDGEEKRPKPERTLADYTDLVDGDDDDVAVKESIKDEDVPKGEKRPQVLYLHGVQRLTRNHLMEIFLAKELPAFVRVEYVSDEACCCVFESQKDAAKALRGALAGFGDTMADDAKPGPGLWRAQRGMLDFRYATTGDVPDMGWKKQHRGGRQVREFRFWEAIKEVDKAILGKEDVVAAKRPASAMSAEAVDDGVDEWSRFLEDMEAPAAKRQRLQGKEEKQEVKEAPSETGGESVRAVESEQGTDVEVSSFDLLEQMASLDKTIMSKHEEAGKETKEEEDRRPMRRPSYPPVPMWDPWGQTAWQSSWSSKGGRSGKGGYDGRRSQRDDREESSAQFRSRESRPAPDGPEADRRKRRRERFGGEGDAEEDTAVAARRKRFASAGDAEEDAPRREGGEQQQIEFSVDEAEKARRARREDRFKDSQPEPATALPESAGSEAEGEVDKRKKRAERFTKHL